jgi:uncharacterized protein (TIGR02466 family)
MSELKVEYIFPTLIGFVENVFTEKEKGLILKESEKIKKFYSLKHDLWLSGKNSPENTYQSLNIAKYKKMNDFVNRVSFYVKQFAFQNNDGTEYSCWNSWINFYEKNNYQEPHSHGKSTYSAVYFLDVPTGSAPICFINPRIDELGNNFSSSWIYYPKPNTLILFRSNLLHYVLQGENNEKRISIALNYAETPESYQKTYERQ